MEGALVGGRFELGRRAGVGGMAAVYRARDRVTGAPVALKIIHELSSLSAERFAREAAMLSQLTHPGIVRYVAHGRTEGGDCYLAMEWLDGASLSERLVRGPLEVGEALMLVERVA